MLNSILYLLFIELLKNGKGVAQRFELWSSLGEFRNELYKLILGCLSSKLCFSSFKKRVILQNPV